MISKYINYSNIRNLVHINHELIIPIDHIALRKISFLNIFFVIQITLIISMILIFIYLYLKKNCTNYLFQYSRNYISFMIVILNMVFFVFLLSKYRSLKGDIQLFKEWYNTILITHIKKVNLLLDNYDTNINLKNIVYISMLNNLFSLRKYIKNNLLLSYIIQSKYILELIPNMHVNFHNMNVKIVELLEEIIADNIGNIAWFRNWNNLAVYLDVAIIKSLILVPARLEENALIKYICNNFREFTKNQQKYNRIYCFYLENHIDKKINLPEFIQSPYDIDNLIGYVIHKYKKNKRKMLINIAIIITNHMYIQRSLSDFYIRHSNHFSSDKINKLYTSRDEI